MTEIVQKWIQDRLGALIDMSPENFASTAKDGHLLATILKSYEIITQEQLSLIEKSDFPEICLANFKEHILIWLTAMGITVDDEELFKIVNSKGTAALNLFYQVYLEMCGNTNLYFITEQRLREKLRPKGRFTVHRVKEIAKSSGEDSRTHVFDTPLREAQDIVHWQKDKMQMLHAKSKEARERYLQYVRLNQSPRQKLQVRQALKGRYENAERDVVENVDPPDVTATYEELVREQDEVNKASKFTPDPQQTRMLLKKFRVRQREHSENLIFKAELQRNVFTNLWDVLKRDEEDRLNKNVTEIVVKQSLYERQMHQKVAEVKLQKHVMLENKRDEAFAISKQLETDFAHKLVMQEKEYDAEELAYYLEKERLAQLHKKLYAHKLEMRKVVAHKICAEAVEDLVTIAYNDAEFREKIGEEPPRGLRESWKKMFTNVIPLDSFVTPTEVILKKPEERPEEIEEIIHLEIERQDMIDKQDMESYLAFEWPWSLENMEFEQASLDDMFCTLNILGNIVHNLLAVKYPYPPLPTKPDFPNIKMCACVNGLDTSCLPGLQEILNLRKILVVEMQDCIDYCVNAFIEETTVDVDDSNKDAVRDDTKKKKGKDKEKREDVRKEKKPKKGAKIKRIASVTDEGPVTEKISFLDKMVQTPKYYPDQDIPLTHKAELGKVAKEVLQAGQPLTSFILAAMFVEYLKSKSDIAGWVLINFPKTYEEAAVLEENLTGLPVPRLTDEDMDACQSLLEMAELEERPSKHKEASELDACRRSKVLPQPNPPKDPDFYDTALTAYIKVIKKDPNDKQGQCNPFLEDLEENQDPLEKFYADLGCNYHFYYNITDYSSIKSLAKLIIGDFSLPMRSSVEIFGEAINYLNADKSRTGMNTTATKRGEKKQKPKEKKAKRKQEEGTTTKTSTEKKSKSGKSDAKGGKEKKVKKTKEIVTTQVVIVHEDKWTQAPDSDEESEEEVETETTNLVNPGEKGWTYVSLPIPENLAIAMATLWENAEEVYLVDMEQVFFMKRLLLNAITPFADASKQHMADYMSRPDEKQKYLREFQKSYNEFEDDFRSDTEFKAEMHCRISEMREKLTEISDWKMIAADHERVFIIEKNWAAKQFIQFTNNYVSALQLELDRFADTMMLLGDYYTSLVTKMPSSVVILKEILPKLELEHTYTIKSINSLLQEVDDSEEVVLKQFIQTVVDKCFTFVEATQPSIKFAMKKIKDLIEEAKKANEKLKLLNKPMDKKGEKPSNKGLALIEVQLDEEVLKLSSQIMEEWIYAVKGETIRVKIRLELLKRDLILNLDEVLGNLRRLFYVIYEQIQVSYRKELDIINEVCRVLALAVEREVKIQEELILDREDFYVDPEVMLFPDGLPPVRPIEESVRTGMFTINQLDKLADILMDLSPSGCMPERSFVYLLQDLIVSKDEPILLPELWRKMQPRHMDKVSKYLFDDVEYVQWKDFIIQNLMVPFPTDAQILEVRQAFRAFDPDCTELVTDYQFSKVKFWFEPTMEDRYRLKLMRRLLFKMYRVKTDVMNYTALLLDFCKDPNPVAGLAKALTVSLGQAVCWEKDVGKHFEEMTRKKKHYEELRRQRMEELKGGQEVVEPIVEEFVEDLLELCRKREEDLDVEEEEEIISTAGSVPEEKSEYFDFSTNIKIGIEPVPDLAYFLSLDVLLTVVMTCLPWHSRVQNIEDKSFLEVTEDVYSQCKHRKFNYKVLSHEFLNHPLFVEQLSKTCKFSTKNPVRVVKEVLAEKQEEKGHHKSKRR
ncbi:sperm flagellar protein 2-like [Anoplophora glabripennis]|uniref:sperm flagellar protein 2-like n=1 Tax=Anoplophora glabripennis TaxID=217634 RepID=UPI0008741FBB|nr:sperm flagellar protein 2-like [Anoplophora glabripennis]